MAAATSPVIGVLYSVIVASPDRMKLPVASVVQALLWMNVSRSCAIVWPGAATACSTGLNKQ